MRFDQLEARQWIAIGLVIFFGMMALGNMDQLMTVLVLGGGMYALARMYDQNQRNQRENDVDDETRRYLRSDQPTSSRSRAPQPEPTTRTANADTVYRHALDAVKAAGLNPDDMKHVIPVDVGVVAFRGDEEPVPYRTNAVPDNVDYIQPFVQLRLATRAVGRVRFEIIDSDGQVLFVHEDIHQLERGRNLITPSARLPIHDAHAMHSQWEMRVSADGVMLASHRFGWEEDSAVAIRRHISEDGEISNELRGMLAESRLQKMSLDELLAPQDEEESQQPRQQRQ